MPVIDIEKDEDFSCQVRQAGSKLVVVELAAAWCHACKGFKATYDALSEQYPNAVFLKVDVEKCENVAMKYKVRNMPTFVLLQDKKKLDLFEGADKANFETRIKAYYRAGDVGTTGVKGMIYLDTMLIKAECECLNESDDHPYDHCLDDDDRYLESDCDEQLILSFVFNQVVKIHSLKIKAPSDKGPKTIRIFINQPSTLDFDKADSMSAMQDLTITPDQLDGSPIPLKFVKFQNVQNLQLFIKDNHGGEDITKVNWLGIVGSPIGTTNMSDFKRVSGKKGEGH